MAIAKKAAPKKRTARPSKAAIEKACQAFVINGGDRSKAYREAFPQSKRWTNKTVNEKASLLFSDDKVKTRVEELHKEVAAIAAEQFKVDANYVLKRLTEIDHLDVIDILNDDFTVKSLSQWPKAWRTSLSGIDVAEIGAGKDLAAVVKKIKWPDKVKNLELLGKHVDVKAFDKEVDKTPVDDLASALSELAKRLPGA